MIQNPSVAGSGSGGGSEFSITNRTQGSVDRSAQAGAFVSVYQDFTDTVANVVTETGQTVPTKTVPGDMDWTVVFVMPSENVIVEY